MKYIDYWVDVNAERIEFDHELTMGRMGLNAGDLYQVCAGPQGTVILQKVDPVVAFTQGYVVNCT